MRKISRVLLIIIVLGGLGVLTAGCGSRQESQTTSTNQVVTVQRGNLSLNITAIGNLALSQKEDLAFEIPGTVEEVMVKEGDSVEEGQALARLDTSEWEKQLTTLERQVTTAERQVTAAEKQLRDKKTAIITAENQVTSKEYALRQAELDLQAAQDALEAIAEVKKVQDKIDSAQQTINIAKGVLSGNFTIGMPVTIDNYWTNVLQLAQTQLAQFQKEKQDLLTGNNLTISSSIALDIARKQLAVEQKQLGVKQAQLELDNARQAVSDAQNAIAPAQVDVDNAKSDLKNAQTALDDARNKGPDIKAPFAGFVTKVSVKGGDEVKKGTVAVQLADSTKFKAEILVSEMDISQVVLNSAATVTLQAVSGVTLPARVTYIAPTATISQGVVNYKVTVELESVQPVSQTQQTSGANLTSGNITSVPPFIPGGRAFGSANLTQEQISQMRQQGQGGGRFGTGGIPGSANLTQEQITQMEQLRQQMLTSQAGTQSQTTTAAANVRLAEGMTVTVSLTVDSRTNVLLVPSRAISGSGTQRTVMVIKDGATESRSITAGLNNGTYTEVISGLSEGEQVVITRTTTTTTTSTQRQQGGGFMIPGIGR